MGVEVKIATPEMLTDLEPERRAWLEWYEEKKRTQG